MSKTRRFADLLLSYVFVNNVSLDGNLDFENLYLGSPTIPSKRGDAMNIRWGWQVLKVALSLIDFDQILKDKSLLLHL